MRSPSGKLLYGPLIRQATFGPSYLLIVEAYHKTFLAMKKSFAIVVQWLIEPAEGNIPGRG
jgi:hypothetical protein